MIRGKKVYLRPLTRGDLTDEYLGWLNDPATNKYSQRRYRQTTRQGMIDYFEKFDYKNGAFFAIINGENNKHIGNIIIDKVDKDQGTGELAILIGDKESRGRGLGQEAWHLMAKHGFEVLGLRKLVAGTVNPAMEKILIKEGWTLEGVLREDFLINDKYLDRKMFGLLKKEFVGNQNKYV